MVSNCFNKLLAGTRLFIYYHEEYFLQALFLNSIDTKHLSRWQGRLKTAMKRSGIKGNNILNNWNIMYIVRYITLMLLVIKNIESSEGWYNNSFCMAHQTSGFTPLTTATSDNFSSLDTTIGALALWWIPLGCNILRHKWHQRQVTRKIGTLPTPDNIRTHHCLSVLQEENFIYGVVYDCLQQRQLGSKCESHSFVLNPVGIVKDYLGNDSSLPEHMACSYYMYTILGTLQRGKEFGIPQISDIIVSYCDDLTALTKSAEHDQEKVTYQLLLSDIPRTPTVRSIPTLLFAVASEGRRLWHLGKFAKHVFYDAGARMLWNGISHGPGRLVSSLGSPAILGIDVAIQSAFSKCFNKLDITLNNDTYLNIGRCLVATLSMQASDLLLNYLVIQRVKES